MEHRLVNAELHPDKKHITIRNSSFNDQAKKWRAYTLMVGAIPIKMHGRLSAFEICFPSNRYAYESVPRAEDT